MIITRYQIKGPKLKAAVVADLHGKPDQKLYDALKAEQPDVILIPGDLATVGEYKDWSIDPDRLERIRKTQESAIEFLRTAVTIAPTFYARGNHEWANPDDVYFEKVRRTGAVLLENEWTKFGEVWIGGQSSAKRYGLEALIEKNPPPDTEWLKDSPTDFKLLLCHHPEYYSLIKDYADCIVAGHAHGGQIRLFGRGLFSPGQGILPHYTKGRYGKMIVSAGLSNTTWVPRLFNPTELVIIEMNGGSCDNPSGL